MLPTSARGLSLNLGADRLISGVSVALSDPQCTGDSEQCRRGAAYGADGSRDVPAGSFCDDGHATRLSRE